MGMPALAMTDHGNVFGAYEFWKQATAPGIKPIIGIEAYVTPGHAPRATRPGSGGATGQASDDVSGGGAYTHMTLLAENNAGMHNLFRLELAGLAGGLLLQAAHRPRAARARTRKGLIATTGCPSRRGADPAAARPVRRGRARRPPSSATSSARSNYFVELMDHGLDIERRVRDDLLRLAKELDLPLVATNDLHYTHAERRRGPRGAALRAVRLDAGRPEPVQVRRRRASTSSRRPRCAQLFRELPEACDNTLLDRRAVRRVASTRRAATTCRASPCPEGETEESWFVKEVERGLHARYPGRHPRRRAQAGRLRDRASSSQMGFPGYFLVVADFINWAKEQRHPGRARAVARAPARWPRTRCGITDLDPLQHGLIFERFLNPDRVSMPDFDIDFDERRRGEVIRYVTEKYGDERVAPDRHLRHHQGQAGGQGRRPRARATRSRMGEKLTKAMPPPVMGKDIPLAGHLRHATTRATARRGEFRALVRDRRRGVKTVVDTAHGPGGPEAPVGRARRRRDHVQRAAASTSSRSCAASRTAQIITQFDYPTLRGARPDQDGLPRACATSRSSTTRSTTSRSTAAIDARARGPRARRRGDLRAARRAATPSASSSSTAGRCASLLRLMQPDNFEDISAVCALYRPGPMGANSHTNYALRKNRPQEITPIHPELAEPLAGDPRRRPTA